MEGNIDKPPDEAIQTEEDNQDAKSVDDINCSKSGEASAKQDINSNTICDNAESHPDNGDDTEMNVMHTENSQLDIADEKDSEMTEQGKKNGVEHEDADRSIDVEGVCDHESKRDESTNVGNISADLGIHLRENSKILSEQVNSMCTDSGTSTQIEKDEREKPSDVKITKIAKMKRKKRSYRKQKQKDRNTDTGDENVVETGENKMDVDGENSQSKTEQDLDVEGLENCKISEKASSSKQSPCSSSKLKRSKCKSQQSSAEHKKRKKALKLSPDKKPKETNLEAGTSGETKNEQDNENDEAPDSEDDDKSSSTDKTESSWSSSTSSDSSNHTSDDEHENKTETVLTDDEVWLEKHTGVLSLPRWKAVQQIQKRELGCFNQAWQQRVCGSTAMVKRLEQQITLDAHKGCVNALHFNQTGTLLASGSDDLDIHIWDWSSTSQEPFISYNSGHRSNVFQAKFMPNSSDLTVVSAARDGQVRVGYLSSTGSCRDTKKLSQHRGSAHKLALDSTGCKSTFLSCGEDSVVMGYDLRETKASKKLVSVKQGDDKIPLYSIDTSPHRPQQFAVSGRDQWARVYDRRMLDPEAPETVVKYCPHHLETATDTKANITCLVYNYDGSELLCSYNDEDIYLFDTNHSTGCEFTRKYKGHRNNATVKGVNFYGPKSEFVVSGSDCGNIFLWDKESSKVVQFMQGDDGGVVNVLEPHPNLPILATSGLDKNIKIWSPMGDGSFNDEKLKKLMLSNRQERHDESNEGHVIDSHLLWFLMRSLRNARGRRHNRRDGEEDDDSSDSSYNDSSEDSDRESRSDRRRMDCLTS
uniref:DDB1- and CUL4-associated factor 8-like n=1 Tax=Styela clava TaxID=7725 RepID=UPI00193983A3|nr:DDB1- and CUL4-associated factor 8-like [Styela clava]